MFERENFIGGNMAVDNQTRMQLIRKGNELFNKGKIDEAARVFVTAEYQDGLKRVGDHYFYKENKPLVALPYYRKAKYKEKIEEIEHRMAFAIGMMLADTDTVESKKYKNPTSNSDSNKPNGSEKDE